MGFKDISELLDPDLELVLHGHRYMVPPPSRETGIRLAAIVASGVRVFQAGAATCPTCGRSGMPDLPSETQALLDSMKDLNLADLALGAEVVAQMEADGLPERHQDTAAQYAMYYWTLGEETADAILASLTKGSDEPVETVPKA